MSVKDIVLAASGQSTTPPAATFQIERSLRFNSADSAYLSRTPSVAGNRRTWTWSGWVKRSSTGSAQTLFGVPKSDLLDNDSLIFDSSDRLQLYSGSLGAAQRVSTSVYRDLSAWYHIVVAVDTTSATAQNRARIWVNNEEITTWTTNATISQNFEWLINGTTQHNIGRYASAGHFNGYITEVHFIDGQALTPSSFGEIRSTTGVWSPKQYTGTYGTNGFYLPFNDNSSVLNLGRNRIPFEKDPDWQQTVLLLSGDGNQGANNINNPGPPRYLAFTDNSDNNFPITVNGDAYGDNFSPFMTEAGQWSNFFDGNGDWLSIANNAAFNFGTGDFTIECWFYLVADATATVGGTRGANIVSVIPSSGTVNGYALYLSGNSTTTGTGIVFENTVSNTGYFATYTATISKNTWHHVAVARSGTTTKLFFNGAEVVSTTLGNQTISNFSNATNIGASTFTGYTSDFPGYLSNVRIVKGRAVYTSNFTPSTTPLGATSGGQNPPQGTETSLLTCQSNRFVDNSSSPKTITINGGVTVKPFNPFTTTYSSTNGSGYFDGTGDYLSVASATALNLATGAFTLEGWVYLSATAAESYIFTRRAAAAARGFIFYFDSSTRKFTFLAGDTNTSGWEVQITSTDAFALSQWVHVAVTRNPSNVFTVWVNGTSQGTATNAVTIADDSSNLLIGGIDAGGGSYSGYFSNGRIVKGRAVYTSTFTPPTAPLGTTSGGQDPPQGTETSLLTCQYQGSVRNVGFIDSSPYDHVITRNPATGPNAPTQGTFSPFSVGAGEWSNYFDGNGDYLSFTGSSALQFGTGDWTVEFWVYMSSLPTQTTILDLRGSASAIPVVFNVFSTKFSFYNGSAIDTSGITPVANTWYHVAYVKSSGTTNIYVNGTSYASVADSVNYNTGTGTIMIGRGQDVANYYLTGYISNLRVVKGRAVYTSAFTPSTVPLGATSGGTNPPQGTETSLLTCQSNRFVDNGGLVTKNTITRNGDVRVTPFSPFAPSAAYSAGTNGGSGYFDGSGDTVSFTNSAALQLTNSVAFTIEMWIYPTAGFGNSPYLLLAHAPSGAFEGYGIRVFSSGSVLEFWDGTAWRSFSASPSLNTWTHIAVTYEGSGTTRRFFVNGTEVGTTGTIPATINYTSGTDYVGGGASANNFTGYISNVRILKGTALYTSNFTPPTAPLTAITNTSLLLNFTNAGIFDNTGKNNLETVGNAQIDTSVKKFGTGSMKFDGTGDYLLLNGGENFAFGTGNFTIEFWYYSGNTGVQHVIYDSRPASTNGAYLVVYKQAGNIMSIYVSTAARITGSINIAANTWYHIAISRANGLTRLFVDGVQDGATYTDANNYLNGSSRPIIGADGSTLGATPVNGYIDDLRITKVAKYTGNFSVPDAPFALTTVDNNYRQWVPTNFSVTPGAGNDSLVDSPTPYGTDTGVGGAVRGNYATLNPLKLNGTLANGSLDGSFAGSTTLSQQATGTIYVSSGKWYFEVLIGTLGTSFSGRPLVGVIKDTASVSANNVTNGQAWSYYGFNGQKYHTSGVAFGATFVANDLIGVAVDMDAGNIWFSKNGTWQASGNPATGANPAFTNLAGNTVTSWVADDQSNDAKNFTLNFGQRPFAYTAPSGFKALCTTNLPNPAVVQGDDHFNPVLYTGTGATTLAVSGVGFQPDFVWVKRRSGTPDSHGLFDRVRGANLWLSSNSTAAETTYGGNFGVLSFDTDGFTVGNGSAVNNNTDAYVAWNWKANGAGVSNTAGSITSTVSANTTAGFSIISYAGNQGSNFTIGHGLGVTPSLFIAKSRNLGGAVQYSWGVYYTMNGVNTNFLTLNSTDAQGTNNGPLAGGAYAVFSSSTIQIASTAYANASSQMIGYCFAAVPGFSAFGSYTGNGSTDGPFVYLGFRPAFVMIKKTDTSGFDWLMYDSERDAFNVVDLNLRANLSNAESTQTANYFDFVSNGFKLRGDSAGSINSSGTYIYAAFAENPFKHSLAR